MVRLSGRMEGGDPSLGERPVRRARRVVVSGDNRMGGGRSDPDVLCPDSADVLGLGPA